MKKTIASLLAAAAVILLPIPVQAGPEEDRTAFLGFYKKKFPEIAFENYVYGALSMNRDAYDQYVSIMDFPPFMNDVDRGKEIWEKPFRNGKTYASCFPNKGFGAAADYPRFDTTRQRVVTFENALNDCLKTHGEAELKYGSPELGLLSAYAKSLSNGTRIKVRVDSPGALAAYEKGKQFWYTRRGQLNFACASCHLENSGHFIRSEQLSMMLGQASHWPVFRGGTDLVTLQGRFRQCSSQVRAEPLEFNSDEFNNLEYFLTFMSNDLPIHAPVFRK